LENSKHRGNVSPTLTKLQIEIYDKKMLYFLIFILMFCQFTGYSFLTSCLCTAEKFPGGGKNLRLGGGFTAT
jgi:hypothetical protein